MIDYTKFEWGPHPFDDEAGVFSLTVPQKTFRPLGELMDSVEIANAQEAHSKHLYELGHNPVTIYYLPLESERLDLKWVDSISPTDHQTLVAWSNEALRQYVESIEGNSFMGIADDFPARVLESIEENGIEQLLGIEKEEIVRIAKEEGVFPFLSVEKVVINQKEDLYQICCESLLDSYFYDYGFGIYREKGGINFAAPQVSLPEW